MLMRRLIVFTWIIALGFCLDAQSAEPVYLFQEPDGGPGELHPLILDDMNPHPLDVFWYTESYFFIAILEGGHIAYVNLVISNMGAKSHQPALTISIITPGGVRLTTEAEYDPEDLEKDENRFRLKMGTNVLEGDSKDIHLELYHEGLGMDLEFKGSFPGYKLGDGKAYFGRDRELFYYIDYPAPRPRVKGTLTINDSSIEVQGWGYVDHCYYNADTTDFEDVWHNFKFYSDDYSVILTSFTTPENYGGQSVALAAIMDDKEVLCATTDVTVIEKDHHLESEGGKNNPHTLVMEFRCPDMLARTTFDAGNIIEKMDVLEKLNKGAATRFLKYLINTFIARPFYYRAMNPAMIQMTINGKTREIRGEAVSEVIFVK
jgi:hypothetical protein